MHPLGFSLFFVCFVKLSLRPESRRAAFSDFQFSVTGPVPRLRGSFDRRQPRRRATRSVASLKQFA